MAAYGAARSLWTTLLKLLDAPNCPYQHIQVLGVGVHPLIFFLENNREVKREFEIQIRDAIYEAQDIIDSHTLSTHFLSPSEAEISNQRFCQDLERVILRVHSIADMTKSEEYSHQILSRKISNSVWKTPDEISWSCLMEHSIVGRDEDLIQLKDRLMSGSAGLQVVPIVGIAGMGKTALARCIYEDPLIKGYFDTDGWIKVSINYNKRDKLLNLLQSTKRRGGAIYQEKQHHLINHQYNWSDAINQKTDDQLTKHLYNSLKRKRYLIVLDDIRNVAAWNDFKEVFPNYHNGSRILVTTRNVDVAPAPPHQLDRLSDVDTLDLLQNIVFYGEPCPPYLGVIAKDIVWSCRGLPHAIVIIGKLLSCAELSEEYWEIVLSSINTCENYVDLIEALVSLTYNHLPQRLKVCLLYMAIFPYNDPLPFLKIMILWTIERFIGINNAADCWVELCSRGFLAIQTKARDKLSITSEIAEEVFRDFLVRKAKDENFFFVINKDTNYASLREDSTYNLQRRLCIQQSIHHFMKNLSKFNSNSSVRSIIYSGPEHQYPLRAWCEDFKLLEVLDAPKIGFYTLPPEILKLVQLRYLAFRYNQQLPATMCNLQNLQALIISHDRILKCSGVPSYLPREIWNLKELRQLQVVGSDLPEPALDTDVLLENLRQLSGVSAHSCTQNNFERITNLTILEVQIESSPDDESLSFFGYVHILDQLSTFKCIVMYPDIESQVPSSIPSFPSRLTILTLSGCGFPWEYMRVIAALPELGVLKLQISAFQGPEWEVKTGEFPNLDFLLLEDLDLEDWTFTSSTGAYFLKLKCLIIRHCYKLRDIPSIFADCLALEMLEVVDCSTSAMNSALEINDEILNQGNHLSQFNIYSSRDD